MSPFRTQGEYISQLGPLMPEVDVFLPNHHEGELITGEADPLKQAEVFQKLGAGRRSSTSQETDVRFPRTPVGIR